MSKTRLFIGIFLSGLVFSISNNSVKAELFPYAKSYNRNFGTNRSVYGDVQTPMWSQPNFGLPKYRNTRQRILPDYMYENGYRIRNMNTGGTTRVTPDYMGGYRIQLFD